MMPGKKWDTSLGIIGRIIDAEAWQNGEEIYWNTMSNPRLTEVQRKRCNLGYAHFLRNISMNGFNPSISQIILIGNEKNIFITGSTHRLGFLLSKNENIFLPAKIFYSPDEREAHTFADVFDDDIAEYTARGVPLERIDQIRERSRKFLAKLRCHILCLVELAQFFEHKDAFFAAIDEIGKCTDIKIAQSRMSRNERLALNDGVPKDIYEFDSLAVLSIKIKYQALYYKDGKIHSFVGDKLKENLTTVFGAAYGYVAGTVTESVNLETALFDFAAWSGSIERPYILEDIDQ